MEFSRVVVRGRNFELAGSAGHGRFGTAFIYQHGPEEKLVCKLIPSILGTDDITHLIKREITILQALAHRNIVRYIESDFEPSHGQQARIYMEYCKGGDLSRADKSLFTPEFISKVFFQLALALAYCHHGLKVTESAGGALGFAMEERWTTILHRDIKPSNVLLWRTGSELVKLCDFGIGKVVLSEMSGTYTGTSAFRPPEITREKPHWTTKSDIYSLGCTILYLIAQTLPPNSRRNRLSGNALLRAVRSEAPEFESIFAIIEKCLDITPGRSGKERPSSLALLEMLGHRATHPPSANNPCNIRGWNSCFNDLISWVGSVDRGGLDDAHEDELVLRLCFLIRDGGEKRLGCVRARTGTIFSRRLARALKILDAEAKFDDIVRIAETLSSTLPQAQRDGLAHELLQLMKNGGDKVTKGETNETPLHRSARRGEAEQTSVLLRAGANINAIMSKGRTALQMAADLGFQQVTTILLMNGADINGRDGNGDTALHLAARNGHQKMIPILLERGADINGRDGVGNTALHLAAQGGYDGVVSILLEGGADITGRDADGNTALHIAALHRHEKVIRILLKRGANIHARNNARVTARDLAANEGHRRVMELLG